MVRLCNSSCDEHAKYKDDDGVFYCEKHIPPGKLGDVVEVATHEKPFGTIMKNPFLGDDKIVFTKKEAADILARIVDLMVLYYHKKDGNEISEGALRVYTLIIDKLIGEEGSGSNGQ